MREIPEILKHLAVSLWAYNIVETWSVGSGGSQVGVGETASG